MFNIELSPQSKKFLRKINKNISKRIIIKIEKLSKDPFPSDVKRIINRKEKIFRVRIGEYRILYIINYDNNLIYISDIDKREKIY
ncbi:type II toxin-antitoxin system RelE/ParE family toxin [Candidatus Woesearchaeota archaeon]|nr:type II toxin-antitoxin system RelE/ParE family toxin [Candidatus Woesearchaeota archaeon]